MDGRDGDSLEVLTEGVLEEYFELLAGDIEREVAAIGWE
jgi:hypothetical protein